MTTGTHASNPIIAIAMSIRTATTISTATVPLATTTTTAIHYWLRRRAIGCQSLWSIENGQPGQQLPPNPGGMFTSNQSRQLNTSAGRGFGSNLLAQALGLIQAMVKVHSFNLVQFAAVEYRLAIHRGPWLLNDPTSLPGVRTADQRNGVPSTSSNSTVSRLTWATRCAAAGTMVEPMVTPMILRRSANGLCAAHWDGECDARDVCVITGRHSFYLGMLIRKLLGRYRTLLSSVRSQTV